MSKQEPFPSYIDRSAPQFAEKRPGKSGKPIKRNPKIVEIQQVLSWLFTSHFHPYVAELVRRLITADDVGALQAADTDDGQPQTTDAAGEQRPTAFYQEIFSDTAYAPNPDAIATPYPVKELDFATGGAYSVYNWELFYHMPLAIALQLSANQRFEDAQKWLHYIFDPTDTGAGPTPERFWKVWPLRKKEVFQIEDLLTNLSADVDDTLKKATQNSIDEWRSHPFRPHRVANWRPSAYMQKAVMAYLDNLIAWGDSLFRQDTGEAINEATQIYIMAAGVLGPRPQKVPQKGTVGVQTYNQLKNVDAFSNTLRDLESEIPFEILPHPAGPAPADALTALHSLGQVLYFCVPRNDKMLGYWDTVADRLFKIHNSLNIQGIFRQLPLFDPPIDPALLARGVAAGLDIGAVVAGLNQPLPLVRCQVLLGKSNELAGEVKAFGASLLASIEKEDGEALSVMRARHERNLLELAHAVKYAQLQDATKAREGIEKSLNNAAQRYFYYERLLGKQVSDLKLPTLDALDNDALLKLNLVVDEPVITLRDVAIDIDPGGAALAEGAKLSHHETTEMNKLSQAQDLQIAASVSEVMASTMNVIPSFSGNIQPFGIGASISFGGSNIGAIFSAIAGGARGIGGQMTYEANRAAKIGTYSRREQEWSFQSNNAAGEITQLFKQLRGAQIREAIARRELDNHQTQIDQAVEIEQFLTDDKIGKVTNQAFYTWQHRELKGLHANAFQLAFDTAKKAERALQHELGDPSLTFIGYDYLSGKESLLAGERLSYDIKRMEMAYLDLNQREYELTRHISLAELDAAALLQLRDTGSCTIVVPEELFDLDCPGHYFRRIKAAAVSLPCVAGPYTPVPSTLTLLRSTIRASPLIDPQYARDGADATRFSDHFGSLQSIVTSSGQNDGGLFETNLKDERYLPFEGSGAVSQWQLSLPDPLRPFDYQTIADVVLHLRYTAREGGAQLASAARRNLDDVITASVAPGSVRLLSVRHEFPDAWADFQNAPAGARFQLQLALTPEHYPYWARTLVASVKQVEFFAAGTTRDITVSDSTGGHAQSLSMAPPFRNLRWGTVAGTQGLPAPSPTGTFTLYLDDKTIEDLWMVLSWGK